MPLTVSQKLDMQLEDIINYNLKRDRKHYGMYSKKWALNTSHLKDVIEKERTYTYLYNLRKMKR